MPDFRRGVNQWDPFSFVDADSDEARTFTTYMGYWDGLARIVTEAFGSDFHGPLAHDLLGRKQVQALQGSRFDGDESMLKQLLLNAWNSELGLYLVDDDDVRLMAQNQWNNVYAYYSTGSAALGWLLVRDGQAPKKHRKLLDSLSAQVTGSQMFPAPWSLACTRRSPQQWHGFSAAPDTSISNLARGSNCLDVAGKALSTTRKRTLDELCDQERVKSRNGRVPNGFRARCDTNRKATTTFDFLWRLRTRSNYGDPSMFYVGSLDMDRSREYLYAVRTLTDATMLLFEALVSQRARFCLVDAADHYMSRDRTGVTATVLGRRLKSLDLLGD